MKLYKDNQNNIYAYEADGSQDAYIKEGLISILEVEADVIRLASQPVVNPNNALYAQLDTIDIKSIRALREGDTTRVANLEAQAVILRGQLVK
jgi:hypothetical protein